VVGCYFPLHELPPELGSRQWPAAMHDVIVQQVHEPRDEMQRRNALPALTPIADSVSLMVQQQYEENPYPRWLHFTPSRPATLDEHLRAEFPFATVAPLRETEAFDILIAGCGTGLQPIERAQRFPRARILAVDLSRSSLAYAQRKTAEMGIKNIDYAQADILALGGIGHSFDLVEAAGSLQAMADPFAAWRLLLTLVRPNGLMLIGLYSEHARRAFTAMRNALAERGFGPTAQGIRAGRQDLISRNQVPDSIDFYSMSGCRDFLFHVVEHRHTIPQIKAFLGENNLRFLGFELNSDIMKQFRERFADPAAVNDLDRWHEFELAQPRSFAAMYQFWVQRT